MPAAFCGAYGLRPTALRNPYKGVFFPGDGQESIRCVIGPLANSVADLNLFQRSVIDQQPWEEETSLVPLPWKSLPPYKPTDITIGVIWDDGFVNIPRQYIDILVDWHADLSTQRCSSSPSHHAGAEARSI